MRSGSVWLRDTPRSSVGTPRTALIGRGALAHRARTGHVGAVSADISTAYLFPGQGAQYPDALADVERDAPDLLDLCVVLLGEEPFSRCDESTRFAQPAILLASLARWRRTVPADRRGHAGHSLGELTALAAAGAISQLDAVRLAVRRGAAMADAAERTGAQGMLAVLRGTPEAAASLAAEHGLVVANDNAPGQLVLSGPRDGIASARTAARAAGMRAIELNVAGAFHSPAMSPARQAFADALVAVPWSAPDVPVYSGLTAAPFSDPVQQLIDAVTAPVRWREVMKRLREDGATTFVDVGPGDVLAKLAERNAPREVAIDV